VRVKSPTNHISVFLTVFVSDVKSKGQVMSRRNFNDEGLKWLVFQNELAKQISDIRDSNGFTIRQLAKEMDLSESTLSKLFDKTKDYNAGPLFFEKTADYLNLTIAELFLMLETRAGLKKETTTNKKKLNEILNIFKNNNHIETLYDFLKEENTLDNFTQTEILSIFIRKFRKLSNWGKLNMIQGFIEESDKESVSKYFKELAKK